MLFRFEVGVKGALGYAGLFDDIIDGDAVVIILGK
jgi:hypothetical protein